MVKDLYNNGDVMEKIYILQMDTGTYFGKFISLLTMYRYSHVAISLEEDCDVTYSFGRKGVYSVFNGGFIMLDRDSKFFRKFKNTRCRIYEVEVTKKQYYKLCKIIKFMCNNKNIYGYDYLGIVLRYLKIPVKFKNKYVCSYFVADLLEKVDVCNFDKKSYFVKPSDFEGKDNFNLIYSGKYLMYR